MFSSQDAYDAVTARMEEIDITDLHCKYDIQNLQVLIELLTALTIAQQQSLRTQLYYLRLESVMLNNATAKRLEWIK